ncbi:MAG: RagB/SusD family nutrient uptake outer membrane protein [Chitinophagaceae bacterium]
MITFKFIKIAAVLVVIAAIGCTKLDQSLNSTLTSNQASTALGGNGTQLLLQNAYNDLPTPYHELNQVFTLEEVTADQCVVPTRAGDWDDNGEWRILKKQTFTANGTSHIAGQFGNLNKLNFDATNVLAFNPTKQQAAEARFLRAISLYQLLDLFGQFPFRNPGDNLLNAPKVLSGEEAVQFLISELTAAITDLPATTTPDKASKDAANFLLMRVYLNHGAFVNRAAPTYSDADMQKVISLGNAFITSGKYSYTANYFDNFIPNNSGSKEAIFNIPSTKDNYQGFHNRWYATLHYNQYTPKNPQAGWNGFSTVADFYNSFGITTTPTQTLADSVLDSRIGGRFFKGATDISGVRPGLLIGQQFNENGVALKDRNGLALKFDPNIIDNLKEIGPDLEIKGIRVIKYVPNYSNNGADYGGPTTGNLILYRYPDVVLMVAEAKMRTTVPDNAGALIMVNALRLARQAPPLATMTLVNTTFIADPKTLLAERGRELYWESVRRTDLIRFGVFMKAWYLKPASDATHLVFPIPPSALASNPNLKQNPGY